MFGLLIIASFVVRVNFFFKRDSENDLPSSIIGGYYAPEKRSILISRHPSWNDIRIRRTPESTKHVFYHELGHHCERVLMSDEQKTELFKIHRLLKKNGVVSQPVEEFFAEVYCIYKTKSEEYVIINTWDEDFIIPEGFGLISFLKDVFNE